MPTVLIDGPYSFVFSIFLMVANRHISTSSKIGESPSFGWNRWHWPRIAVSRDMK